MAATTALSSATAPPSPYPPLQQCSLLHLPDELLWLIGRAVYEPRSPDTFVALAATCTRLRTICYTVPDAWRLPPEDPKWAPTWWIALAGPSWEVRDRIVVRRPAPSPSRGAGLGVSADRAEAVATLAASVAHWGRRLPARLASLHLGTPPIWTSDPFELDVVLYKMFVRACGRFKLHTLTLEGHALGGVDETSFPAARLTSLTIDKVAEDHIVSHVGLASFFCGAGRRVTDFRVRFESPTDAVTGHGRRPVDGFVDFWFTAPAGPAEVPLSPAPRRLLALHTFDFDGTFGEDDGAALAVAAPNLRTLKLTGALLPDGLQSLGLPALPRLHTMELDSYWGEGLFDDLAVFCRGRALSVLVLPVGYFVVRAYDWVVDALVGCAALPASLTISDTEYGSDWLYSDDAMQRLAAHPPPPPDAMMVVGGPAAGVPRAAATHTLTKLVVALNHTATAASIVALAALPALTTLDLCLTGAPAMTFPAEWPPFPALTTLAVGFDATVAAGSTDLVRSLSSGSCPALTTLRLRDRCAEAGPSRLGRPNVDGLAGLTALTTWVWAVADDGWLEGVVGAGRPTTIAEFTSWVAAALPRAVLQVFWRDSMEECAT